MERQRLLSLLRQAIDRYEMIQPGDHIAVGLSGGKDSLTLLSGMAALRRFYPKPFSLSAICVDLGMGIAAREPMETFCKKLEVPFELVETEIGKIVFDDRGETNPCSLCARLRKGALNEAALRLGCGKIAYAHHRDDMIETALLSLLYEGRFYSFQPVTHLDRTGLTVIRPLLLVSEAQVKGYVNKQQLPVLKNPCPADGSTKRMYVKNLIRALEKENPGVKKRLFHAVTELFEGMTCSSPDRGGL